MQCSTSGTLVFFRVIWQLKGEVGLMPARLAQPKNLRRDR